MSLQEYFEGTKGLGVLATSDSEGNVDVAIYSRPHVMEDGSLALIMRDRLSHKNLQSNPKAAYLFKEEGQGYKGKRLFLKKIKEEQDTDRIQELRRRTYPDDETARAESKFLVFFALEKELPLIGPGK